MYCLTPNPIKNQRHQAKFEFLLTFTDEKSRVLVEIGLFADPARKVRFEVLPPCQDADISKKCDMRSYPPATAVAPGTLLLLQGHCCCSRDIAVAPGTLLLLLQQACFYFIHRIHRVEKIPALTFQNTRVLIPGMLLDGSGL